jgi:hypothetical protein
MDDPHEPHLTAMTRILHYLQGTLDHDLLLHRASTSDLVIYTDADWDGCPNTRWSTLGYVVFLGDNLISWFSKRRNAISHSSAEVEYHVVANDVLASSTTYGATHTPIMGHYGLLR